MRGIGKVLDPDTRTLHGFREQNHHDNKRIDRTSTVGIPEGARLTKDDPFLSPSLWQPTKTQKLGCMTRISMLDGHHVRLSSQKKLDTGS